MPPPAPSNATIRTPRAAPDTNRITEGDKEPAVFMELFDVCQASGAFCCREEGGDREALRFYWALMAMAVAMRILVECGLTARRTEVERPAIVIRRELGLPLIYLHVADGIRGHLGHRSRPKTACLFQEFPLHL